MTLLNLRFALVRVKHAVLRALGRWPVPARLGNTVYMRPMRPRTWEGN